MVKVSVIVPVYNGELHLRQCLDSICQQTLQEIEIICVDDGSTDSSVAILEEYAANDGRMQIYRQENQYAGVARNLGKRHATGEYLVFWDCDDFFEVDALEKLYNQAVSVHADICVCNGNQYYEELAKSFPFKYLDMKQVPDDVFNRQTNEKHIMTFTNAAPWNKMFRRTFVEEKNLQFQAIRNGNDVFFVECAIALADRITVVDEPLVTYRRNQAGGLVNSLDRSALTPIRAWMDVAACLEKQNALPEQSFANKAISSMIYMLRNLKSADAFLEAAVYLKDEGFPAMHITDRDADFYYNQDHYQLVSCLCNKTPQEFQTYLAYWTYIKLTEASAKSRALRKDKAVLREKNRTLTAEKRQIKQDLKAVKQELRDARKEQKVLKKEYAALGKQLSTLKQKNEALEKENRDIRASYSYKVGHAMMWLPGKIKRIIPR